MTEHTNTATAPGGHASASSPSSLYTLTTLYELPNWQTRDRFDAFRKRCGRTAYFVDAIYGQNLATSGGYYIDLADCDRRDRDFLHGAEARKTQGIRLPWSDNDKQSVSASPTFTTLTDYLKHYTIWPTSHALFEVSHKFALLIGTILDQALVRPDSDDGLSLDVQTGENDD